ncbi:tail fiber domain-containing protein [Marinoscillum sp.]|uniref:tail fiber domain-containing protein n=1 Tax=Marinoscillum sp. TaxID=2024838 RepID=UPI003BAD1F47
MIIRRVLSMILLFWAVMATAQKIPFQGKLTENDEPVTGSRSFTFSIQSVDWTETHESVSVLDGFYSVVLGSVTPIPDSLFDDSDAVQLGITVGETDLSPITIYAPIGTRRGRFVIKETTDTTTIGLNVYNNSTGTSFGTGSRIGAYIEAAGEGLNTGVFAYAENGRSINNQSELTDPQAYVTGQLSSLYGYSDVGGRAMQAQYTAEGPGPGVGLSGYAGGGGVNWAVWGRANSGGQVTPVDTLQVGAYVEAYGPGSGMHVGVRGIASGENASRNIGVHGLAYNGANENWAGWFDGNVNVNGELIVNGETLGGMNQFIDSLQSNDVQVMSPSGNLKAHLNYYEPNNAGSLVLYGGSDTTRTAILGSSGITGGNSGLLYLYDQFDQSKVQLRVDTLPGGSDDFGVLRLFNGDYSSMLYLDGSTGSGTFPGDLNVGGDVLINGQSISQNDSIVTKDIQLLDSAGSIKAHLNIFDNTSAGSLVLNGANDSTKVILGSAGGGYGGFLGLYDSLRNIGAQLRVTNNGRGNLYTYNESHVNVGWFGGYDNDGFAQLVSYDDSDSLMGAVLLGSFIDGTSPEVYIEGAAQQNFGLGRFRVAQLGDNASEQTGMLEVNRTNGGGQAVMTITQDQSGTDADGASGVLNLFGDSTPNIFMGSQSWEDHDRANINLYGTKTDGGSWYMSGSDFGVARISDGTHEFGFLNLHDIQDGVQINTVSVNGNLNETGGGGLELRNSGNSTTITLDGSSGNIDVTGQVTAGGVALTSDKRYKKEISTLSGALDNTRKLRGTSYYWKDPSKGTDRQIGVIAQEVEAIYPEFVHTNEDGYKSVNYSQMVAVLIEAVKELDAKVSSLQSENSQLKAALVSKNADSEEIESLKSEIESIKKMLMLNVDEQSGRVSDDR